LTDDAPIEITKLKIRTTEDTICMILWNVARELEIWLVVHAFKNIEMEKMWDHLLRQWWIY
jgi:hypothetical protein